MHTLLYPRTNTLAHGHLALCKDGDLKLVGSTPDNEGRLEVCFDQRWGTINGNGWTYADTQVACRQLGLPTSGINECTKMQNPQCHEFMQTLHLRALHANVTGLA